jgi:Phytanoyl-CoA dioxygenase (PhyH)
MIQIRTNPDRNTTMDAAKLRAILPGVPLVESPFFEEIAAASGFDDETARVATDLNKNGFAVLRFPDEEFDGRAEKIKQNLAPRFDFAAWRAEGSKSGMRVQDAWTFDSDVRALAVNPRLIKILSEIFGRKAWPFQTLNFPVGSQQHYHSDSVHFSSIPERFMCGVWVALEDVSEGAGPLEYYPGSHKWPIVYNDQIGVRVTNSNGPASQEVYHDLWEALVEKTGVAPQLFFPRQGDTLIWAANLLHGGSRQRDPDATRWSQVTHYFFENCCYITPMHSDVPIGKLQVRDLTDIVTGAKVPNIYIDAKLSDFDPPPPPPPPSRLERLLRDPVKTTKNALARLSGFAAHQT